MGASYLKDGEAGVGVFDGGDTAVGVEGFVGIFFEIGEFEKLEFIFEAKLLEEDGDLPWVGALYHGQQRGSRMPKTVGSRKRDRRG